MNSAKNFASFALRNKGEARALVGIVSRSFTSQADDQYVTYNKRMYGNFMYQKRYRFNIKDGKEPERQQTADDFSYDWTVFSSWENDAKSRYMPVVNGFLKRKQRLMSKFNAYHFGAVSVLYSLYGVDPVINMLFYMTTIAGIARNKSRLRAPEIDEVGFRDTLHGNEEFAKYFSEKTMHILNVYHEYDQGFRDDVPEYNTKAARFFNTDTNFTSGMWVVGDVDSGAYAKIHFKTMPYSTMRYACNNPFKIYSLWAEIIHEGEYKKVVIIDPRDVKLRPFVMYT